MKKTDVYVLHSSHLDLYWIGAQADCLSKGAAIIDNALTRSQNEPTFHFMIETARFLEYYAAHYPHRMPALKEAFLRGQFEMAASYSDRLENHVGGESLVRNVLYGRKIIQEILGLDCDLCCHPDLPGFAEQTPQIYKKSGVNYYLSARGFKNGSRFRWRGLDGTEIIMYNFPGHYAYYDVDQVVSRFGETKKNIASDVILLGCSAGDMGAAGTFIARVGTDAVSYEIGAFLKELEIRYPEYHFELVNARRVLERMPVTGLSCLSGEFPSRWGHHGSAMNVQFYLLDKQVERKLTDAEKLATICGLKGLPVSLSFKKHPLKDPGGNGGERRYFDLEMTPDTVSGWIEYAWRLQVITQDHNFGGVEGAQSEFDRMIYKRASLKIADALIDFSLAALAKYTQTSGDMVSVFNTMNWERDEVVTVPQDMLGAGNVAVDAQGRESPLVKTSQGWQFLARDIPSMGMSSYKIRHGSAPLENRTQICDTEKTLTLENKFYRLSVDKDTGCIQSLYDNQAGKEWMRDGNVLMLLALRDSSLGGSESQAEKELLDMSGNNVRSVRIKRSDALLTQIEIITEILDVKVYQTLTLFSDKKQFLINLSYNWPGTPDVQIKMALCRRGPDSKIIYGTPYGAQEYGKYMEKETPSFGNDEISLELFHRYREVQGFFAVEEDDNFLMAASNQSALDFIPGSAYVILARDVRNGAERDYRFTNAGQTDFEFCFTSGKGSWKQAARMPWERRHPVYVRKGEGASGEPNDISWVKTEGNGILTVLAPAATRDGVVARLYNPTPDACPLKIQTSLGFTPVLCVNMNETPAAEPLDTLGAFEIKTVLLTDTREK